MLAFIQPSTFKSSSFIFCSSNAVDFPENFKLASSAKSLILKLQAEGRLLMYMRNNNGPSMDPCGTPLVSGFRMDWVL